MNHGTLHQKTNDVMYGDEHNNKKFLKKERKVDGKKSQSVNFILKTMGVLEGVKHESFSVVNSPLAVLWVGDKTGIC